MQAYRSQDLRNIVLMGHRGSGKTSLAEAALFLSGAIKRMGRVEDGNTVSDFEAQEHAHHYSISSAVVPVEWGGRRLNLLDTPGFPDFEGEVVAAAGAAEAAIITVDAVGGIQAGTDIAWQHADAAGGLPRIVAVTRLDRENANFDTVLAALRKRFGLKVVPLAIPIGTPSAFAGVIDVLRGRSYRGAGDAEGDVPEDRAVAAASAREMLIESVAGTDDALLNDYLEGKEIEGERLAAALALAVSTGEIVPVIAVANTSAVGVRPLLDYAAMLLPSPIGR
ncbi:MAG: elongation factor G, partial [Dehalococcoidia bacterium]